MSFSAIIGQPRAVKNLKSLIKANRVPPALLFYGPEGVGKDAAALEFAKALNCLDDRARANADSCGVCSNCVQIQKGLHPDVTVADFSFQSELLEKEEAKQQHVTIETIREIVGRAQHKPVSGMFKVFIVERAETMLAAAANAFLKFLEEPPASTVWVLVSSKKDAMLGTIRSRCQAVPFSPLSDEVIEEILVQQSVSMAEAKRLAALAEGSVSRAVFIRGLAEKIGGLDSMDPMYPFNAAKTLPSELAQARHDAGLMIELVIAATFNRWQSEKRLQSRESIQTAITNLFKYRNYIRQNVSPQLTLAAAIMEVEPFKISLLPS